MRKSGHCHCHCLTAAGCRPRPASPRTPARFYERYQRLRKSHGGGEDLLPTVVVPPSVANGRVTVGHATRFTVKPLFFC
jgi:hypothetical protein